MRSMAQQIRIDVKNIFTRPAPPWVREKKRTSTLKGLHKAMIIVEPFQGSEDSIDRIPRVARLRR